MLVTKATVIKTDGNRAYVRAVRKSACDGCEGCADRKSCHAEILLSEAPKAYELDVENRIGANKGDIVEVQSEGNSVLVFAFAVFILPIIFTIVSYFVSAAFLTGSAPVFISAAAFIISFVCGAFAVNRVVFAYSANYISKIIKENSDNAVGTNAYKK